MLSIDPAAAEAVREIVRGKELPERSGLRITATQLGDDVTVELDFGEPDDGDATIEGDGGALVHLDALASEVLADAELVVEPHGDHVHFEFVDRGGADEDEPEADG